MSEDKIYCYECNKVVEIVCPICNNKKAISSERERTAKEIFDEIDKIEETKPEYCCRFCVEGEKNSYGKYECDCMTELKKKFLREVKSE